MHAERRRPDVEGVEMLVGERLQGTSRQLFLGEGLDTERIDARYADGVLAPVSRSQSGRSPGGFPSR